jgi:hypothetical protein
MTRNFTDDINPRRTPKQIADSLLNGKIATQASIQFSHETTITGDNTFADFILAQKFREIELLVLGASDKASDREHRTLFRSLMGYIDEMKSTGSYPYDDVGEMKDHFNQFDAGRPLKILVERVLPKISRGEKLEYADKNQLAEAVTMLESIVGMDEHHTRFDLEDKQTTESMVHNIKVLDKAMAHAAKVRIANEILDELESLNREINGPPRRIGG